jgi:DNA recombination protein RmuC
MFNDLSLALMIGVLLISALVLAFVVSDRRRKPLDQESARRLMAEQMTGYMHQVQGVREELIRMTREQMAENRLELSRSIEDLRKEVMESYAKQLQQIQNVMNRNLLTTNELQREKLDAMVRQQELMIRSTEKRLDDMRLMVEEKLHKTLNERIGQSFELVRVQLENVQQGLGEMKTLAQDVGGLKRVLTNVKTRGVFGEVQLSALLEQMLSPEQYEVNVKTRPKGTEFVEFAIKLPGKNDGIKCVYLPIDAKFPKDIYEKYLDAHENGDLGCISIASHQMEQIVKRMARDIHDKYLEVPYTTDFAIMFLPFENIYAEVIRRTALVEYVQRKYHVIVTGPTTLGAILTSLQMGFRTLAIEKRSSEVWTVLAAVKTEFGKFGGMLEKVQKNLETAGLQLDEVLGKRTRAIVRKLRQIQELPAEKASDVLALEDVVEDDGEE